MTGRRRSRPWRRCEASWRAARSALVEEQEGHRAARRMLAGVRQALEQASAAVVKLRFAKSSDDRANAAAQAEMQAALAEAQQRQWQAESDLAQLRQVRHTDLENERAQRDAAQQGLASAHQQLRDAQAALVQGQERETALQQGLSRAQERLAQVEGQLADEEATRQALAQAQDELVGTVSALAEEQEGHRGTRRTLSGVRQALEQASAAVVKLRFAQARQNEANGAAQAALRQELIETQQRHWQAEEAIVSLRQELSQAQGDASQVRQALIEEEAKGEAARLNLASTREHLARSARSLEQAQGRNAAQGQVLAGTQAALSETSASLAEANAALAEQAESHASEQAASQSDKQQWVERYWEMERQSAATRAALRQRMQRTVASLQEKLSQAQEESAQVRQGLLEEEATSEAARLNLASTREQLADVRRALEQEQGRSAAQGQVLAGTQAALSETSASLAEANAALAEQAESHASEQAASQSDKQQWVERYWDMERQSAATRAALRQRMQRTVASLQEKLSQAQEESAQVRQGLLEEEATSEAARLNLASTREQLADVRRALEQEQGRSAAQGQVLAGTQAALSETSASLAEANAALAEQAESHASEQAASQSDKQQWVERYWDMEQQRASTRAALRTEELAHQETQQALDQTMHQAQLDDIRMSQLSRDAREASESLKREMEPSAQARALADLVSQRFADEIQQGRMSVRVGRRGVKLSSADMFDFARAVELGTQSVNTLDRLAEILQEVPSHRVRFAVHSDNIPLRQGSKWPTNWELSTARAAKLARYLITDKDVAGERLSIAGYGEYRPVADNSTPEGRQQNRRVEVIIKAPRSK